MTLPGRRGLGYKPDAADARDYRYGASSAPALPPVLFREPDLSSYVGRIRDQGDTSSCVGQALAAAIEITSLAIDGNPLNVSARWLYAVGREAERRGTVLLDDGTFPRLAMSAANARGILPEKAFPFSRDAINAKPTPDDAVAAYDLLGLRFFRIDAYGEERLDAVDDALRRGCCVLFGSKVSAQYQYDPGEVVTSMGSSIGGHMEALVRCGGDPLVLNSWGTGWGHGGYARWSRDFVGHYEMSDIYAVTRVPRSEET